MSRKIFEKFELKDLPKNWKQIMFELSTEGAAAVEVRVKLGISRTLWYRLIDEEQDFKDAVDQARDLSYAWWVKFGRENLRSRMFQGVIYLANMRNRFNWDKDENKQNINININKLDGLSSEQLKELRKEKLKELAKENK